MRANRSPSSHVKKLRGAQKTLAGELGLKADDTSAKLAALAALASRHGLWDQAITALEQACRLAPGNADLLLELGYAYQFRRRFQDALDTYYKIIAIRPEWVPTYANLGSLLLGMGRVDLSIAASRIGVQLDPNVAGLYINLAAALRGHEDPEEAYDVYEELLRRFPNHPGGLVDSFHLRQHLGRWDGFAEHVRLLQAHTYRQGHRVPPFSVVVAVDDPEDHRLAARTWTNMMVPNGHNPLAAYAPRPDDKRDRRLRIGYLSSDFYNHATALLLIELLELRDRDAFEVFGYSTGNLDDGTLIRNRIISAFDICYDVKNMTDQDAAKKIHGDEIDILIDLKGFTQGARPEIMSFRPAPIQVNYLGYPGTMGAPFIDYIIGDPFVLPHGREADVDEHVVRLPHCYQPNDRKRPVSDTPVTRAGCGLPEDGFVFCSFNATYKVTPEIYDLWMRLLHKVPGSVLWLLEGYPACNQAFRHEAVARGIAAERIVLAPKLVTPDHLARMKLGDLFLDSFPVNAHTTASDALWVGLPVLTCPGQSFVSRVAGSLLHAIGLPELIVGSMAEYEAKALELVADPAALQAFRDRLTANRLTTPLFDSERYTRDYEAALLKMAALRDEGLPPVSFDVPASA